MDADVHEVRSGLFHLILFEQLLELFRPFLDLLHRPQGTSPAFSIFDPAGTWAWRSGPVDAAAVRQGAVVLALLPAEVAVPLRAVAAVVELPRRAEAAVAELPLRAEAAYAP